NGPTHAVGLSGALRTRSWLISLGTLVLLGFVLIFMQSGFLPTRPKEVYTPENIRQTKLTQDGNVYMPVISRDVQYLASVAIHGKGQAISVRQLSTGSVLEVVSDQPVMRWGLAVAAGNSFVVFLSQAGDTDRVS